MGYDILSELGDGGGGQAMKSRERCHLIHEVVQAGVEEERAKHFLSTSPLMPTSLIMRMLRLCKQVTVIESWVGGA